MTQTQNASKSIDPNTVSIGGRLTKKPEISYTPSGKPVANVRIANNQGQNTNFIDVTIWDKQAENLCQYLDKGSKILVEGTVQSSSFEDAQGNKRTSTFISARMVHWLDSPRSDQNGQGNSQQSQNYQSQPSYPQGNTQPQYDQQNQQVYQNQQPAFNPNGGFPSQNNGFPVSNNGQQPYVDAPGGGIQIPDDDLPF